MLGKNHHLSNYILDLCGEFRWWFNQGELTIRGVNRHEHDPQKGHVVDRESMVKEPWFYVLFFLREIVLSYCFIIDVLLSIFRTMLHCQMSGVLHFFLVVWIHTSSSSRVLVALRIVRVSIWALGHSNHEAKQLQCSAMCSLSVAWYFVVTFRLIRPHSDNQTVARSKLTIFY